MSELSQATSSEQEENHSGRPRLINVTMGGAKDVFMMGESALLIGRASDNHVRLESTEISRNHAAIVRQGENFVLNDFGSTNGSYVNGEKVVERKLEQFDVIRFGPFKFLLDLGTDFKVDDANPFPKDQTQTLPLSHQRKGYNLEFNVGVPQQAPSTTQSLKILTRGGGHRVHLKSVPKKRSSRDVSNQTVFLCRQCYKVMENTDSPLCYHCRQKMQVSHLGH